MAPQLDWCLQRRCLCEPSVSPQLHWCLQRRSVCGVVVLPMAELAAVRLPPGPGHESDVIHRLTLKCSDRAILAERRSQKKKYIGVCRGGVCVSDLCRRSYFGFCRGGVSVIDLCRRSYIGVCRGTVCVNDLNRCSYIGVCRGRILQECQVRESYKSVK